MSINSGRSPSSVGRQGERIVCDYLHKCLGWDVVDRNVRTRFGELDIVAHTPGKYIFVEVKTRTSARFGSPIDAVTPLKSLRLMQQSCAYFATRAIVPDAFDICLDVVGITLARDSGALTSLVHTRLLP
ncbi:YraN family protein [Alicyclobacillus acidoterrestris]|uniref:UPF0102 protein K1I37_09885 n=1 Tax=Alicyclobacillus acidoterrestris (strain ATCC 49025 / DSM 3922 / CIP 106132 / NCIMB 13137 / GD3B) TaxID=1356854 RepID=A0A9E6ZHE0_ALIAG|nr:YraN family protein [Alicyclobacillus acidoterrestris]UNO50685.1 YraN family protein [Alicyclobacillus acidoterrestris]